MVWATRKKTKGIRRASRVVSRVARSPWTGMVSACALVLTCSVGKVMVVATVHALAVACGVEKATETASAVVCQAVCPASGSESVCDV